MQCGGGAGRCWGDVADLKEAALHVEVKLLLCSELSGAENIPSNYPTTALGKTGYRACSINFFCV